MSLSERQKNILLSIIEKYVQTAEPVGSEEIARFSNFALSSATIRNEMAILEEKGYLYQPHTSAGRIPTDKGYRFFVNHITTQNLHQMDANEQRMLETELVKLKLREKMMARTLARLLSTFSHNMAITGLLEEKKFFESGIKELITQPDFQNTDEICQIAEMLDYLDENIEEITQELEPKKIKTLIGQEHFFTKSGECAIIISQCLLPEGEKGIIAILGPKRMEYRRNISIIENVVKFLEDKSKL